MVVFFVVYNMVFVLCCTILPMICYDLAVDAGILENPFSFPTSSYNSLSSAVDDVDVVYFFQVFLFFFGVGRFYHYGPSLMF